METDYQENYHKAREVVAQELIAKYGMVESYRDYNKLSLDSDKYSFHMTFYIPYCDELYVSKVSEKGLGRSFQTFLFEQNPKIEEVQKIYKSIFSEIAEKPESEKYSTEVLIKRFLIKSDYLALHFPEIFEVSR